ncbi:MAG TPA: hypothetical protein DEW32_12885 [Dehalococcoidia bacterium]|nr:hypothetical protein [Dehalococcoidia bacterium]
MRLILLSVLFMVGFALWSVTSAVPAVQAQTPSDRLTVLIIDRASIQGSQENIDLINSFLGLFFKLKEGQPFVFIQLDDPTIPLGPVETDREDFSGVRAQLDEALLATSTPSVGLAGTLAEVYNLLNGLSAGAESVIYFVTASDSGTNPDARFDRLEPILNLHIEAGWPVFTVVLPRTNPGFWRVLQDVSDKTGGESYFLDTPDGFRDFTDRTLRLESKGSLTEVDNAVLDPDTVIEISLNIAPGTDKTTLMFFKDNEVTDFRLKNPYGFEASTGDRTSSSFVELPHLVMWELVGPMAGKWQIEVRGNQGQISVWVISTNKYTLGLQDFGAVPVGEPTTITAFITEDGTRTTVESARLSVKVTAPDGLSIIHELNDDGVDGDAVAQDSHYAVTIPPLTAEGEYRVDLELSWPGFEHTINSRGSFQAQTFPALSVTLERTELLIPGDRAKIATVFANVNGQPFSVLVEDITLELAANAGEAGNLELVPQSVITQGRAFMYDLFYTPGAEAFTTVIMRLNLEYAGRQHSFATDTLILSSYLPTPVPAPLPTPFLLTAVPVPTQAPLPTPVPAPVITDDEPPIILIVVLAVVGGIIVILVIFRLSRPTPHGFLYNDQGEVVVDFAGLVRSPMSNLISRNVVRGVEVGILGLEGVTFTFRGSGVFMSSRQVAPATVRVNNQPLIEERAIDDSTWIGTSGRLYKFSTKPAPRTED